MDYTVLPTINALLNATTGGLLVAGYRAIKARRIERHRAYMIAAMISSALFLASYVTYHTMRQAAQGLGHTIFAGPAWLRPIYYALLISHVVLAAAILPPILITFRRGLLRRDAAHARLARRVWPAWIYVSASGVVVYLLLYHVA